MRCLRNWLIRQRAIAATLVVAALLLRALVPAGYMLAPGQDGRTITVALCSGSQVQSIKLALPGDPHQPQKSQAGKDSPCAFAGTATLADLSTAPQAELAPFASAPQVLAPIKVRIGQGLAAPPPPQTGPPSHA